MGDQKQVYTIYLSRDASENKGVMNLNVNAFQTFQQQCEQKETSLSSVYPLDGFAIFKGCTSGWESSQSNVKIVGRLSFFDQVNKPKVLPLMYTNFIQINNVGFTINSNLITIEG